MGAAVVSWLAAVGESATAGTGYGPAGAGGREGRHGAEGAGSSWPCRVGGLGCRPRGWSLPGLAGWRSR
jgi:hypothetical protein